MAAIRPRMPGGEQARADHQAARADLLQERADDRIDDWMRQHIADDRLAVWGPPDTSANPLATFAFQASSPGLYVRPPTIRHVAGVSALVGPDGLMSCSGLWPRMQYVQYLAVGINAVALKVEAPSGCDGLAYRPVLPHDCYVVPHPEDPTRPIEIWELRLREIDYLGSVQVMYCWDVWSIADPDLPFFRVVVADTDGSASDDVTSLVADHGPLVGADYPHWGKDGRAILPWVIYRAKDDGTMWAWERGRGIFRGSLNAMLNWSYAQHTARDASGGMVCVFDASPVSTHHIKDAQGRTVQTMSIEPGSMVMFKSDEDKQGRAQPIGPGGNLESIARYARDYELQQLVRIGLNPADISRTNNGPMSGAALYMSNHQKRELQTMFGPLFRRADLELIKVSAVVARAAGLGDFPEEGYSISYAPIPKSPGEESSERDHLDWQVDRGMISPVDRYMVMFPGATRTDAVEQLARAQLDAVEVSARFAELALDLGLEDQTTAPTTTLNGAQVTAALEIVGQVAGGLLPRDTGVSMLAQFLGVEPPVADSVMGSVGAAFVKPSDDTDS